MLEGVTPAPKKNRVNQFSGLFVSAAVLQSGDVLGGRYEIMQLLGEGGMGAVYKAKDRELDRFVALKLIRPELAANPAILARFKQELLLAHQVTHKNVIRIYDLTEAEGIRFITMEYIEGSDLRTSTPRSRQVRPCGSRGSHSSSLFCASCGTCGWRNTSRSQTAKHHAGQTRTPAGDGFWFGTFDGIGWHDPDRRTGWHHGVHVSRTSHG